MHIGYEDDKTLDLLKDRWFSSTVLPKKIVNPFGSRINNFINNKILSSDISFV